MLECHVKQLGDIRGEGLTAGKFETRLKVGSIFQRENKFESDLKLDLKFRCFFILKNFGDKIGIGHKAEKLFLD